MNKSSLVHELKEMKRESIGRLKIVAQFAPLYYFFPKVFRTYRDLFPLVDLSILERPPREAMELVRQGEARHGYRYRVHGLLTDLMTMRLRELHDFTPRSTGLPDR